MQTGKDTLLRLMIVDDSGENAEAIVSALRNGGITVRPLRPLDEDELVAMVASQPIDLVLASRSAQVLPLDKVLARTDASGKDLPVIILADAVDEALFSTDLKHGVRAVALRGRNDHLLNTVRTEYTNLETRRALRRLEAQLRETERRCDALIASSRDPIAYIHEGMHIRANTAYLDMFGFDTFEDIEGLSLLDLVAPQHVADFKALLKRLSKGEAPPPRYELEAANLDGDTFPATLEFATATYEGEPCVQVVFRRREFDPELAREVEDLRQRDLVTGLLNRPTFLQLLETAVNQVANSEGQHALLLVEPDHYQRVLHEIGLDSADDIIASLATRLEKTLGSQVIAARFGEHRFAVLLDGDHAHTASVAEQVRATLASHVFTFGERSSSMTVSIGGVQIGEKIASLSQVLARAAESIQQALELGGNRIEIFDPGAVDRAEEERIQGWVDRLRHALDNDGFVLHYQPLVNLQGEPGELYESHLRLESGDELLKPQAFLAIAEDHGLLERIDHWVVSRAIQALAERQRSGHATRILVEVSPNSFGDGLLLELIRKQLATHGVDGSNLWLEASEARVFTHLRGAQDFLAGASQLGCRVGLNRFGAGLDSFQLLSHFKPAFVKLDRSFVEDFAKTPENKQQILDIARRAREASILSIIDSVADAGTMSFLFTAGVDFVQGQFLAPSGPSMNYDFS